jgi:hypothetical protein
VLVVKVEAGELEVDLADVGQEFGVGLAALVVSREIRLGLNERGDFERLVVVEK